MFRLGMDFVMLTFVLLLAILSTLVNALDNGLALTPTMGWRNWKRFRCEVDCETYPNDCIGEKLFMDMADAIVAGGFKDDGYDYVLLDDCWPAPHRDSSGRLQADPKRFPHGIKALADNIHSKGLKFGIYEDFGTKTCAGYIGSEFYMQTDAQTFADWGADLVFFDHCYAAAKDMKYGFPIMEFFLNKTGRPMIFTCPWPMDNRIQHIKVESCLIGNHTPSSYFWWKKTSSLLKTYGAEFDSVDYNFITTSDS